MPNNYCAQRSRAAVNSWSSQSSFHSVWKAISSELGRSVISSTSSKDGTLADGEYCTGPYGNGHTHNETQWACYGFDWNGDFHWQVNVDPWGERTYHTKL